MRTSLIIMLLLGLASCASGSKKSACSMSSPFTACTSEWRPDVKAPYNPVFNPNHHNGQPVVRVNTK